jgi:hypothetical protein
MAAENSTLGPANPAPLSLPMWQLWTGRVLSALPVLLLLLSASMKLSHPPMVVETFVGKLGYPANVLPALAALELFCAVVYAVPRTAVLGAVLLTGYLGGAVATHVRVGEAFVVPLLLGVLVLAGLYLRDERIRALLPLRNAAR